jgi:outer membrane protein assembly factor BamB
MFALRLAIALLTALPAACGRDDPAATADAPAMTAAERRRERCAAVAEESASIARIGGGALTVALADKSKWNARTGQELAAAGESVRREILDQCMRWPDDVIDCLGPFGMMASGCDEKLAEALGVAEPKLAADIPTGPAPAWTLALAEKPAAIAVADDGTVLAIVERQLVGVRDGAIAWRAQDELRGWLVVSAGVAVVARRDRVIAVDPGDGRERWSVAVPPLPDADEYTEPPAAVIAAVAADGLWLGDREARFFRVHPDRCARNTAKRPAAGCLVAAGALVDETLDGDARLFIADDRRALHESGVVRMFDASWTPTLTARARDHLGAVVLAPAGLALVIDDDVVLLDPDNCGGEPFAPSAWPQPGQLYVRGSDECSECVAPPPGCRRWRMFVESVTGETPVVGDDGTVVVHADGFTRAIRAGADVWKTATGGDGPQLRIGDAVIGVSTGLADDDPLALFELGLADGRHRWRTPLAIGIPGTTYYSDDIVLVHDHGWLIAGYRETIAAIPRPAD